MRILTRTANQAMVQADESDTQGLGIVVFHFVILSPSDLVIEGWDSSLQDDGGFLPTAVLVRLAGQATEYLSNVIRGLHS